MGYKGHLAPIPLGSQGLRTDDPMNLLPANAAIKANNIYLHTNRVEKSPGSAKYNSTALSAGIITLFDWFPVPTSQRLIAMTRDGKVFRDTGDGTFTSGTAIASGLGTLTPDSHMCSGGSEIAGNNKKLFFFTAGLNQVKVLSGDGSTIANIAHPATDWATNFPSFGVLHGGRLWAFGNSNGRHRAYASSPTNHENFLLQGESGAETIPALTFDIFPGEGDGLYSAIDYRGRLFFLKKPFGIYYLNDADPDPTNWGILKYSDSFGVGSPHSVLQALTDVVAGSSSGSYISMSAVQQFGDIAAADLLSTAKISDLIRQSFNPAGISQAQCMYYAEKKLLYFTARSTGGTQQDRFLIIDVNLNGSPRFTIETKDQPSCVTLRKDAFGIDRPIYGNDAGFVLKMDQSNYNVAGVAYLGEFQTPFTDFSFLDQSLTSKNKLYDFLDVDYVPTGNWAFYIDVYIDGKFSETLIYNQLVGAVLGTFRLDFDVLGGAATENLRLPLHGSGKRISFRIYNNQTDQNFKVEQLIVSFRVSAEQVQRT